MEKSPFVEKLIARGYEVLYFTEPLDEMMLSSMQKYGGMKFQDVAKKGLKYGDEDEESDKLSNSKLEVEFGPLREWLKKVLSEEVNEVIISTRLTTSPCAITVDPNAWTGNMARLMAAQTAGREDTNDDFMTKYYSSQKKTFEINPGHPLISGMLERVQEFAEGDGEEEEVRELALTLWDTAAVRSGFEIKDFDSYFNRIDVLLRRSLGISESAKPKLPTIIPAPETAAPSDSPSETEEEDLATFSEEEFDDEEEDGFMIPEKKEDVKWQDWQEMKKNLVQPRLNKEEEMIMMQEEGIQTQEGEDGYEVKLPGQEGFEELPTRERDEL